MQILGFVLLLLSLCIPDPANTIPCNKYIQKMDLYIRTEKTEDGLSRFYFSKFIPNDSNYLDLRYISDGIFRGCTKRIYYFPPDNIYIKDSRLVPHTKSSDMNIHKYQSITLSRRFINADGTFDTDSFKSYATRHKNNFKPDVKSIIIRNDSTKQLLVFPDYEKPDSSFVTDSYYIIETVGALNFSIYKPSGNLIYKSIKD